jgi:hypothetical protein
MNTSRIEKIYLALLTVIFGVIVLHAPLAVGLSTLFPDYELLIKSWKELLMLIAVPLAFIIVTRRGMWRELSGDWIFRLVILYAALHVILVATLYRGAPASAAGLAIDLRYVLFFALAYVLIRSLPVYRKLFIRIAIIGAAVVVGFATLQLFLPPDILKYVGYGKDTIAPYLTVDKNPDYIRINSTLRGPNPLGAYAGVVLTLLTAALVRGRLQVTSKKNAVAIGLLTLCSLVAVWISYSRSALVAVVISISLVLIGSIARQLSRKTWIITAAVAGALIGGLIVGKDTSFVSNVLLHENPNGGSTISSNDDHVSSLQTGLQRMIAQPFGAGVGSTGSASLYGNSPIIIENQYLFIAHEVGWLGLGLYISLFVLILWRLWRVRSDWLSLGVFASGIGLALIGLLLPVWADDTVAIVWWGLAAISLAKERKHG